VVRGGIRAGISRHDRRVQKVNACAMRVTEPEAIHERDTDIYAAIQGETKRQRQNIELIASENYVSRAVREAQGSVLTNKYAEGYPGKRYYNGCEFVDEAERLAIERAKQLFGAEHANVQPHSGSGANMAVYFAMLQPGDTILAMSLAARRAPDARAQAELLGALLQRGALRRESGDGAHRLRRHRAAGGRAQAQDDLRGRERLFAHHRFQAPAGDRRFGRRAADGGHGAHRGTGGGGVPSEPGAVRRFRDDDDAQDAARAARRPDPVQGGLYAADIDKQVFPASRAGR
jgi:hypothetical protein